MADSDDPRFTPFETVSPQRNFVSGSSGVPGSNSGFRQRMLDRRFAQDIRNAATNRRFTGSQRRAAVALAKAERDAPRSPTAVNRPVVSQQIRLLRDAVNSPRLTGSGRRALVAGAAELAGREDLAEDLVFGRRNRGGDFGSLRGFRGTRAQTSAEIDPLDEAAAGLRQIQARAPNRLSQSLSRQNEFNPLSVGEETFQDDFLTFDPEQF